MKRESALLAKLPLPPEDLGTVTWKRGRLEALHVFNERDWMDDDFDVMATLMPVFELPMCDGLRELRTGVIRWNSNSVDVPAVLEAASKRPFARRLERLVPGRSAPGRRGDARTRAPLIVGRTGIGAARVGLARVRLLVLVHLGSDAGRCRLR